MNTEQVKLIVPTVAGVSQLLASKTGIDGATLATTTLDTASGITLANYIGTSIIVKYNSGTLGICVATIKREVDVLATLTLLNVNSAVDTYVSPLFGPARSSKLFKIQVTTASLAASTFDVFVYGIAKS